MKTLTGTVAAQKEALYNQPLFLAEVDRDHPETGTSTLYVCAYAPAYTLGTKTYEGLVAERGLDELVMSIAPGGGLATISEWGLRLTNPTDIDSNGRLSDMHDEYFLENDEIRLYAIFRTGSETETDLLTLFVGQLQDTPNDTEIFELRAKDGTRSTLVSIPRDVADFNEFPNVPLDVINTPLPVPFGTLNTEPFNTEGKRPRLAFCLCVDKFAQKYTSGRYNKTYDTVWVWYRSARFWAQVLDVTQTGAFFTIDTGRRTTKLKPMRPELSNDVAEYQNVMDGNIATGATIGSGDNLDLRFKGAPKLGSISAITIEIVATGSYSYVVKKAGESDITDSASGNASIDLSGWDFDSNWDFERIVIEIDGPGADSATINLVTLDLTYLEQETGDQLAFDVFQAVEGYEDQATRYVDVDVINTAGLKLDNPIDQIQVFMRDKNTCMRMPIAQLETANLAAERVKLDGWVFDFTLDFEMEFDEFGWFCEQAKTRVYRTYDAKWKLSVFDKTAPPVALFTHDWNINVDNPEAPADEQRTSLTVDRTPLRDIANNFILRYGYDKALKAYTEIKIASPHFKTTGTGTLDAAAGVMNAPGATFITDNIQVGYKCFLVRDQLYQVTSVNTEEQVGVDPVEAGGDITDGHTDTFFIGPNFDYRCYRSSAKFKLIQDFRSGPLESRYIQDDDTAQKLIDHLVDYWSERRLLITFRTALNAVDIELGDFIIIDHPDIHPKKRPVQIGSLVGGVTDDVEDTVLPMDSTGALLTVEDDVLILKSSDPEIQYHEAVVAEGVNETTFEVTVSRAEVGTTARTWASGDEVWRAITKFEVVGLRYLFETAEIEVIARETPRDYNPVKGIAPEDTPDWVDASAEENARYMSIAYPNGEVVWNDPDSDGGSIGA